MARNDEWCELCDDKLKEVKVIIKSREFHICKHCESLVMEE